MIAKAKYLEALGLDSRGAYGIRLFSLIGIVLPAIELDHQLCRMTDEIGDVVLDRDLAAEARAIQAMIAEF